MQLISTVSSIPLFKGLQQSELEALAMILTDQRFYRGQHIFSEGDKGVGFYVVISGKVKIYKLSAEGKEQILHVFGPGEPFAEVAVFAGVNFPANALAIEESRIFFFPRTSFISLIEGYPTLAMNMMAELSLRLKRFAHMIEDLSLKEVPGRLASHFLLLAEEQENEHEVTLNLTKSHLASLLGTIPETLSRILTKMSKQNLIESQGSTIAILDYDALGDLASGERRL
nr:Crp/Fnr family transcriptional regulator [Desulfobulbaceae bacterium]